MDLWFPSDRFLPLDPWCPWGPSDPFLLLGRSCLWGLRVPLDPSFLSGPWFLSGRFHP